MTEKVNTCSEGSIIRISDPHVFFRNNVAEFNEVVGVVRRAFGTEMTEDDIFRHVTLPHKVYLLNDGEGVFGMCGYSQMQIAGQNVLFVDGIAIDPSRQARGIFNEVTSIAREDERFIGLKTQNPRMYRALEKFCKTTYPNESGMIPADVREIMLAMAVGVGVTVDDSMVARGFYGTSLYPAPLSHSATSHLFDDILKVDYSNGDSVLCLGLR